MKSNRKMFMNAKRNYFNFKKLILLVSTLAFLIIYSCKKEAGEGGTSTITGKIFCKDYNGTFTVLEEEYYIADYEVYLIYGSDISYSKRVRTCYNGIYEFKYLRPGKYRVYAFSKDSTLQTQNPLAIIKDIEIKKNRQTVEVPLITIFK